MLPGYENNPQPLKKNWQSREIKGRKEWKLQLEMFWYFWGYFLSATWSVWMCVSPGWYHSFCIWYNMCCVVCAQSVSVSYILMSRWTSITLLWWQCIAIIMHFYGVLSWSHCLLNVCWPILETHSCTPSQSSWMRPTPILSESQFCSPYTAVYTAGLSPQV